MSDFQWHTMNEVSITSMNPVRPLRAKIKMDNKVIDAQNDLYSYYITDWGRVEYFYMYTVL